MEFGWIPRAHLPPRNHMLRRPVPPRSVVPSSPCTPSPYGQEVRGRAALAWCCADRDVVDSDRPISQSCAFGGSGTTGAPHLALLSRRRSLPGRTLPAARCHPPALQGSLSKGPRTRLAMLASCSSFGLDDQVRLGALQSSAQLLASASLRLRGTAAS
ncbi:uncharacterized protein LOC133913531 isoform X1 [Phragmites australis]|uniref:uncharacterized protein LOC133913531 isoform X1 n=1 Tax=Phragmites australis TaxID=29695 RepID=UPI002D796DB0|nr:uncharacterized protein LOC133913531 isoform X1 [Phragmites australis]